MAINPNFGGEVTGSSQLYPALQALKYRGLKVGEEVPLCLGESSYELLSDDAKIYFAQYKQSVTFGDEDEDDDDEKKKKVDVDEDDDDEKKKKVDVYVIPDEVKFIFLGKPALFCLKKDDNTIHPLREGMRFNGKFVSVTRCILCIMINGEILTDKNGCFQYFTLKLKSNKTKLVFGEKENPKYRSLVRLNQVIASQNKVNPKQTWMHLVSIGMKGFGRRLGTTTKSTGVIFELIGETTDLPDELQPAMYAVIQSDEVKNFLKDPFNLSGKKEDNKTESSNVVYADDDDSPF
jgi:hypothetical protein